MSFFEWLRARPSQAHFTAETEGRRVYRRVGLFGFEYLSDLIAHDYMRRWILKTPWAVYRVHKILRSDVRDDFHDHPFDFTSIILKGGYVENTPDHSPRWCFPGTIVKRRATDFHYLELIEGPAWTFVVTTPEYRRWGFQTQDGWIDAADYDAYRARRANGSLLSDMQRPSRGRR